MIYMWFGGPGSLDRPFRSDDEQAIAELVQGLVNYRPDPERMRIQGGGLPANAPDPATSTTDSGASFYAIPLAFAAPSTLLFAVHGFEVGLAFATEHTAASAWGEVARLITDHDRPGVDWLLVSVGTPNRLGQVFPSDEAVARFAIDHPRSLTAPPHIKRVTLRFWDSGEAWDLLPEPVRIFGPLYSGNVVPHQPLVPASAAALSQALGEETE
jgi:hypothetical protein